MYTVLVHLWAIFFFKKKLIQICVSTDAPVPATPPTIHIRKLNMHTRDLAAKIPAFCGSAFSELNILAEFEGIVV